MTPRVPVAPRPPDPPRPPVRDRAEVEARVAELAPVLRALGVERVRLFGSFARGEQTAESDVDLLVDLRRGTDLFDLVDAAELLEQDCGRSVDLVPFGALSPYFSTTILAEARDVAVAG